LRGAGEVNLKPQVPKLLRPQEHHHPLRGQFVLPNLDAGILYVRRQLGKDKRPITRRWRKRLHFLNRVVGLMLSQSQLKDVLAIQLLPNLIKRLGERDYSIFTGF
jgi:hypothetical protein